VTGLRDPLLVGKGGNYTIEIDRGVALVRVWKTPVDSETGARYAEEKIGHLRRLSREPDVRGLLLDLADAPPITGPRTQGAIEAMVASFEGAGKTVAVLSGPSELQRMQLCRIVRAAAPSKGAVVTSFIDAIQRLGLSLRPGPG